VHTRIVLLERSAARAAQHRQRAAPPTDHCYYAIHTHLSGRYVEARAALFTLGLTAASRHEGDFATGGNLSAALRHRDPDGTTIAEIPRYWFGL
jgi:hypothetical protein